MRYRGGIYDNQSPAGPRETAVVVAPPIESPALALRHARAMAAVIRAAKAQHMARRAENSAHLAPNSPHFVAVFKAAQKRHALATQRLVNAMARLVAVEKEVSRGQ